MSHILLVEPDKVLAEIYIEALLRSGHTVAHKTDAQAAIQAVDKKLPDLIILELQLAGHNGVEFLYELRSYPELASIPVIVLSYVRKPWLNQKLQASLGIAALLYKPQTNLGALLRAVQGLAFTTA